MAPSDAGGKTDLLPTFVSAHSNVRRHWLLPLISAVAAVAYWQRITFGFQDGVDRTQDDAGSGHGLRCTRHRGSKGRTIIIALVLHAAGDGLLDLGRRYLLAGMGMFFLGHLGYIAAFYPFRYAVADLPQSRRIAIVALVVAMAALSIYIWPRLPGVMAVAAPAYTIALTAMTVVALLGHWRGPLRDDRCRIVYPVGQPARPQTVRRRTNVCGTDLACLCHRANPHATRLPSLCCCVSSESLAAFR